MKDERIRLAISGDSEAFAELFKEVQEELYRIAYLYLKNEDDACDAVQETAYRCFKSIKRLKKGEYFRTWAVKIVINCSLDILKERRKTLPLEDFSHIEDEKTTPEVSAEAKDTLDRLLNLLDEGEKSVLLLKCLYELSFPEISKTLGLPLGTVKTIFYRSVSKIKRRASYEKNA